MTRLLWLKRVLALLTLLILSMAVFIATPMGLTTLGKLAEHYTPLRFKSLSGQLLKVINITDLHYNHDKTHINIKQLHVRWNPFSLLTGTLNLKQLTAHHLTIQLPNSKSQQRKSHWHLKVAHAFIQHANISQGKHHWQIKTLLVKQLALTPKVLTGQLNLKLRAPWRINTHLTLHGSPSHYQLTGQFKNKQLEWYLRGQGSQTHFSGNIRSNPTLHDQLNGQISWQAPTAFTANVNAHRINLHRWDNALPSQVDFHLTFHTSAHTMHATLTHIIATYPDQTLRGQASLNHTKNSSAFSTILDSNITHIHIKAELKRTLSATWQIQIPNVNAFDNDYAGSLKTTGEINGPLAWPQGHGSLTLGNVSAHNTTISRLKAQWQIARRASLKLTLSRGVVNNHVIPALTASLNGNRKAVTLSSLITLPTGKLSIETDAQAAQDQWHGTVKQLNFTSSTFGNWHLSAPSQYHVSLNHFTLSPIAWQSNKTTLTLAGSWQDTHWAASLQLQHGRDQLFDNFLPDYTSLAGKFNLTAQARGTSHRLTHTTLELNSNNSTLFTPEHQLTLGKSHLKLSFAPKHFSLALELPLNGSKQGLSAHITNAKHLSGQLNLSLNRLTDFSDFLPSISNLTGSLSSQLRVGGTWKQPKLFGHLTLSNASFHLQTLNVSYTPVNANITANGSTLHYHAQLNAKKGKLTINGTASLKQHQLHSKTTITGTNTPIMNTLEFRFHANPKLTLTSNNLDLALTGSAVLPSATINLRDMRSVSTLPAADIIYLHQKSNQNQLNFSSNIQLIAGNNVNFSAYGLSGQLTGNVTIQQSPNTPTVATGTLTLNNGNYQAYGQSLTISKGQANYAHNPLNNPSLNIMATRAVGSTQGSSRQNFVVGIKVTGPLQNPTTTLFSAPTNLTQADILSYLLFGHANQPSSADKLSLAIQALSALNITQGGGNPINTIKKRLGINELGVETTSTIDALGNTTSQQSSFVVGKYITPRLYVRYSSAISGNEDTLLLQYYINNYLSIQTESSTGGKTGNAKGIDLLYSFDY